MRVVDPPARTRSTINEQPVLNRFCVARQPWSLSRVRERAQGNLGPDPFLSKPYVL